MRSATGVVDGSLPSTTTCTMSRSVRIPTGRSSSHTTTAEIWFERRAAAASAMVAVGATVTTPRSLIPVMVMGDGRRAGLSPEWAGAAW